VVFAGTTRGKLALEPALDDESVTFHRDTGIIAITETYLVNRRQDQSSRVTFDQAALYYIFEPDQQKRSKDA